MRSVTTKPGDSSPHIQPQNAMFKEAGLHLAHSQPPLHSITQIHSPSNIVFIHRIHSFTPLGQRDRQYMACCQW